MPSLDRAAGSSPAYINLKLAALGQPVCDWMPDSLILDLVGPLLRDQAQPQRHDGSTAVEGAHCPADARIQRFLNEYLDDVSGASVPQLPTRTFTLDRPGLARTLSLPARGDRFESKRLKSYRIAQGVLHNPAADRRTTQGIFHIAAGGFPVPADKIETPRETFAALLRAALLPPRELLRLPFTSSQEDEAHVLVSLLLRPIVCPATARDSAKTMEIRFFAPGSLVSNLDFVESIFGNAGDPSLPRNDAALDVEHWTGHTGCVILAPHLVGMRKKDLGLPHCDHATPRQRRDGMCWSSEDELYNEGRAFKLACRDHRGVMVTIIADNYYGYCKKEVKTQISYAANLYGLCEEEHAGGAIAFANYVLGQEFYGGRTVLLKKRTFAEALELLGDRVLVHPEGYASDRQYPSILYVPETASFNVRDGVVRWENHELPLKPEEIYVLPSGYKIRLQKQAGGTAWRLVGSTAEGTLCHKPCTVSGGGKSEISKSIAGVTLKGPVFVRDYESDMAAATEVLKRDYSNISRARPADARMRRPVLSAERSLGSVIKLLTPSAEYTDEHNAWLASLPSTVRQLVFTIKRYYRPEWGDNWKEHLTVDRINGRLGHELKYKNQKLVGNYLRVGFDQSGAWRIYKLRPDFHPADKVQVEDDITASVVLPADRLNGLPAEFEGRSVKLVTNCETMLFQRPDDAIHRGADEQAEADIAEDGVFLSNYEPLTRDQARELVDHVANFDQYTEPMKARLRDFINGAPDTEFVASSAHPRLVDGKPSKNPRYLQKRPDLVQARETYVAEVGARLVRGIPANEPLWFPVNAVLAGRRNNPPDPAINLPALAVYNPIHYQELPELFMEFIASLTGKSPSTTGFGSEGALTKGPFNALWPVVDLNNALVSAILTGHGGFSSAAGHVGPDYRVDHDISMLVPEVWCRMKTAERDPAMLIREGYLERLEDFEFEGRTVMASRLGYRMTAQFAKHFFGRLFETPDAVFTEEMLKPELQDPAVFADGVDNIVSAQKSVAQLYFEDGSVEAACPPLRALLHIMACGSYEGKDASHPEIRALFTRESVLASEWYRERLTTRQQRETALWTRHVKALDEFCRDRMAAEVRGFDPAARLEHARAELARVSSTEFLRDLVGTLGADPFHRQMRPSVAK